MSEETANPKAGDGILLESFGSSDSFVDVYRTVLEDFRVIKEGNALQYAKIEAIIQYDGDEITARKHTALETSFCSSDIQSLRKSKISSILIRRRLVLSPALTRIFRGLNHPTVRNMRIVATARSLHGPK